MRLRQLDFLRGIAILLVLVRHEYIFMFLKNMGWIGVDLFFVLSGFLVSGLLFQHIIKNTYFQPIKFLIRRGFKIYPLYFLSFPFYLLDNRLSLKILPDIFFVQNYFFGWGYLFGASWSLAVEEHFYLIISILFFLFLKFQPTVFIKKTKIFGFQKFVFYLLLLMLLVLVLRIIRIYSNQAVLFEFDSEISLFRSFTMSHLRIDALLAGVIISYYYYFDLEVFKYMFKKHSKILLIFSLFGLSWTPFIEVLNSPFALSFGFTLVYLSFAIIVSFFLIYNNINKLLNLLFTKYLVDLISKIGFCSYAIYIVHTFVNHMGPHFISFLGFQNYYISDFIINVTLSILIGFFITFYIESYFLKLRSFYFPAN